ILELAARVLCSEFSPCLAGGDYGSGTLLEREQPLFPLQEEDLLSDVCREVVEKWSESHTADAKEKKEDEVQALASMMEKQARIVVKPKEVSQEEKQRKAALLAQYANVTDEEDGADDQDGSMAAVNVGSEKSLFRNTNVEDVLNARKLERELLRDEFQKKKEQDKLQREKDKLAKQERKEKEKKRTQKGERKR
ncbi:PREDICTED: coiled-coil domain-containing protein 43, partial [Buceros rhinoceros silvestris]|uniref:coiled-coil domain-containing protein 43 n=1 Tax=Buceros rhinoceros silvestris TaxID=175836 RepID=UPI0005293320